MKADKAIERRDRQLNAMTAKLEAAHAEQEAAVNRSTQLREQLENMHAEMDKTKTQLNHTTKELKVRVIGFKVTCEICVLYNIFFGYH